MQVTRLFRLTYRDQLVRARAMSPGQIKPRIDRCIAFPSRFCIIYEHIPIYIYTRRKRRTATKLVARERGAIYKRRLPTTRIAANDGSEQVSTVKRRSASGDGVNALNTRATNANFGATLPERFSKQKLL